MFTRKLSSLPLQRRFDAVTLARKQWRNTESMTIIDVADGVDHDTRVLIPEEQDGILTLTLNRPKQRNALNGALLESLRVQLETASQVPRDIRVVVIQSQGNNAVFSSGHDLKEMMSLGGDGQRDLLQLCSHVMQLLPSIPQPTIAAVDGLATAAGCQLVAACDLAIGNPMSGYSTPGATTIGLFCHTPAVPLVRCIGLKRALEMLYTGRTITAPEALQYGLITSLAANPRRQAAKLAHKLAGQSAGAMQAGKQIFYQQASAENLEKAYDLADQGMLQNLQTEDAKAGIESFLQKTAKPEWIHT